MPVDQTIPVPSLTQLFARQAALRGQQIAAYAGERSITFYELNCRANQIARQLREIGIGSDVPVGVFLERSIEMLVTLFGIFKAGAAYLPVDPVYPEERLRFMLSDSQVPAIVCNGRPEKLAKIVPLNGDVRIINLQDFSPNGWVHENTVSDHTIHPQDLAYVIYTSGSTGKPKGVLGTHAGMLNRLSWMWNQFPFTDDEVCCVKTSLNFLDSFWEIFGPLLQGVPVVLLSGDQVRDPDQLVAALQEHGITRLVLVPSLLRALLNGSGGLQDRLRRLRICVSSGEELKADLVRAFYAHLPHARLLNLYGSSEVSADCTWFDTKNRAPELPSLGQVIPNNTVHVLDSAWKEIDLGEIGELYVGGLGLARGYSGRPDLTAERFLPSPFSEEPGSRLFRTGDIVRKCANGCLEYVGRADQQVKIRGFRVELGEIEATLLKHPAVTQVAVTTHKPKSGNLTLLAYVVPATGRDSSRLRDYLAAALPDYMVPSRIIFISTLPLTPSGKLDRNSLPQPQVPDEHYDQPFTAEGSLQSIFLEVLELKQIDINHRFFDLGGDSLAAVEISRLARTSGLNISALDVLRYQTIIALAQAARRNAGALEPAAH